MVFSSRDMIALELLLHSISREREEKAYIRKSRWKKKKKGDEENRASAVCFLTCFLPHAPLRVEVSINDDDDNS